MSAANRRKGKTYEREIRDYLRAEGHEYDQLRLHGSTDEGDGVIRLPGGRVIIIEAKNTQAFTPGPHIEEAKSEARNYEAHRNGHPDAIGVVWHKRRQHNVSKSFVILEAQDFLKLIGGTTK